MKIRTLKQQQTPEQGPLFPMQPPAEHLLEQVGEYGNPTSDYILVKKLIYLKPFFTQLLDRYD